MERLSQLLILRLSIFARLFLIAVVIITGRLFELQIRLFTRFFALGERNFLRTEKIVPPRGNILDCKGRPLATSSPITALIWQGTGKRTFNSSQIKLITFLEELLDKKLLTNIELLNAEKRAQQYLILDNLPFEQSSQLLEQYPKHENILLSTRFKRTYPHHSLACHIVGYLGSAATRLSGKMGLEKMYEQALQGNPGQIRKKVNSQGHALAKEEIQQALKGKDLETTIDLDLQKLAEDIFPTDYAGVIVALSPLSGALKVVASRPAFDPNIFVKSLDPHLWNSLQEQKQPFLNRAFSGLYPPASLFKLVTIAAALENNLAQEDTLWECKGHIMFAGRPYYCNKRRGHGTLTTLEAVAHSCNIPFYELGKRIKVDVLAHYAYKFGLGSKTYGAFCEKAGLIPTTSWKLKERGERWWPGETLSAAIGQSSLLVTPIQMACMVSGICEGYLVKPSILKSEAQTQLESEKRILDIQPSTREFLKKSMHQTVMRGTGKRLNRMNNITIYAKSGTAQISSWEKRSFGKEYQEHAWFIAYIAYKDYEPLTLLILLEHAGSSSYAVDLAKLFINRYRALADAHPHEYKKAAVRV